MRIVKSVSVVLLSLGLTGCWFGKKKTPKVPVNLPVPSGSPPSATLPPLPQGTILQQPTINKPPEPQVTRQEPTADPGPQRKRPVTKPSPAPKPAEQAPIETPPAAPSSPAVSPPRLGEVLDEETRKQYEAEFANHLASAQAALQRTDGRRLSPAQAENVQRIQSFIQQAQQARDRDLSTGLQLAKRADLLGQDLVASLQ